MIPKVSNKLLVCGSLLSAGVSPNAIEAAGMPADVINDAECRSDLRGIDIHALTKIVAAVNGNPISQFASPTEIAAKCEELLAHGGMLSASASGNVNLKSVYDEAANISIAARYAAFPSVRAVVAKIVESKDFRPWHRYEMSGAGFLEKVGESGELTHLKYTDSKLTLEMDTAGAIVSVPRKMLINNANILDQLGVDIGWKGAQTLERDIHRCLLDPLSWTVDKDRFSGAGTAFGIAALKAAADVFGNQLDESGLPISASVASLLVQAGAMGIEARDINNAPSLMPLSTLTTDRSSGNPLRNTLGNIVETQWLKHISMNTATQKLASNKAYFHFSDPEQVAAFGICFLSGQKVPKVEFQATAFHTPGMSARVIWDYAVGRIGKAGAIRNDGE